jgi:hypothetical protein
MVAPAMDRPSFLTLGAACGGTTTLHHALGQHPHVLMSTPKEPRFFEAEYERGLGYYWQTYVPGWRGSAPPARRGTPTCGSPTCPGGCTRASRTPGWPDGERLWRSAIDRRGGFVRHRAYLDAGYYARHLERYRALFPADRIRVLLFDDLRRDPAALLRELCRFLEIDPEAAPRTIRAENTGLGTAEAAVSRLALRLHLRRLVGRGARTRVRALLSRLGTRPRVPEPARRWLVEHYAPHNAALERLLGRDLSAWRGRPAPAP